MLHLIAFDDLDSDTARACLSQYRDGDLCVFADAGRLIAADFPLHGPAFILEDEPEHQGPVPARPADLETIDPDRLVALIAEQGPVASWYP